MATAVTAFSNHGGRLGASAMPAGQVLEHMAAHPTRPEVCYRYEALARGCRGIAA
ncbi:MAG TPA: hypothetical protein PLB81_12140 [Deltaproteobacteria bacterium]|nr:hypothetical protein [Deltaproteobacteria bacterium]